MLKKIITMLKLDFCSGVEMYRVTPVLGQKFCLILIPNLLKVCGIYTLCKSLH